MTADSTAERVGVYPGSFDPVTVAHLHVAEAAASQCGLARVVLSISVGALGKDDHELSAVDERLERIGTLGADRPWLTARRTDARLLADIAEGFDVLIMGADKWHQLLDPVWYPSVSARDESLARLPLVAVAPRAGWSLPSGGPGSAATLGVDVVVLDTDPAHHHVSASAVRSGRDDWRARP